MKNNQETVLSKEQLPEALPVEGETAPITREVTAETVAYRIGFVNAIQNALADKKPHNQ